MSRLTPESARELHAGSFVFDGHNDLPWQYRTQANLNLDALDITQSLPALHTDIPRLREGGLGAQFWSESFSIGVSPLTTDTGFLSSVGA